LKNKLYAGDQHLQLNRYYDFITGRQYADQQIMMFYLTIDGNDPSEYSIEKRIMNELKNRKILRNLSYKSEIKDWLQNLTMNVKANNVKSLINQYLTVINQF
jgi:2-phosphoglycerate kinase